MERTKRSLYQSLEQRQFRLLRLPESETNGTQCEMKDFSLLDDDLPPWKALSYRWGEDNPESTIYLNDHPIRVRKGLQEFITQMIAEKRRDWYFIDALCIDQDNELERAVQVQQMGEIYRRAEEVVVWIIYEPYHYQRDENYPDVQHAVYDIDDVTYDFVSFSSDEVNHAVLQNSYWSRLWVVQEVLLAQRLTIRIGNAEVNWSDLLPETTTLDVPWKRYNYISPGPQPLDSDRDPLKNQAAAHVVLYYRRWKTKSLRAGYHLPFHKAVENFALQRCSVPHDVVFGYLGLTNSLIEINYSMPILELFMATLANWLLSAGFIRQNLTGFRRRRTAFKIEGLYNIPVLLQAFGLDPCEPVVHLLFREITKFFAPGLEDNITNAAIRFWLMKVRGKFSHDRLFSTQHKSSLKMFFYLCINVLKAAADERPFFQLKMKQIAAMRVALEKEDALISGPGERGETKKYSQWASHARAISEQIWQRFMEAGEDAAGNVNDDLSILTV